MKGLPGDLYRDIRNGLMDCGPFNDPVDLQPIFTHPDLYAWRNNIPSGRTKQALVDALITFLYNKPYDKPNPLGRFLNVLSERVEEGCQRELSRLAHEVAFHLGEEPLWNPPNSTRGGNVNEDVATQPAVSKKEIFDALLSAFPNESDLSMMVTFELDESLNQIVSAGTQKNMIFQLINWADANGKLDDLVLKAHNYNPGNPALAAVAEKLETS